MLFEWFSAASKSWNIRLKRIARFLFPRPQIFRSKERISANSKVRHGPSTPAASFAHPWYRAGNYSNQTFVELSAQWSVGRNPTEQRQRILRQQICNASGSHILIEVLVMKTRFWVRSIPESEID